MENNTQEGMSWVKIAVKRKKEKTKKDLNSIIKITRKGYKKWRMID